MTAALRVLPNENPSACGPCRGKCCKQRPGYAVPDDFGSTNEERARNISAKLRSGLWCIDWWDGLLDGVDSPDFIRPAEASHVGELRHAGHGSACALLTETGCSLRFAERPVMCRALEPHPAGFGSCRQPAENLDAARAWIPYQDLIRDIERTVAG